MEWRPAGWTVCLPLLIFSYTIKSRSSLLAPAHPGSPRKRAVKVKTVVVWWFLYDQKLDTHTKKWGHPYTTKITLYLQHVQHLSSIVKYQQTQDSCYFGLEELCVVAVALFVAAALPRSSHLLIFRFTSGADASVDGADFLTPFWNSTYTSTHKRADVLHEKGANLVFISTKFWGRASQRLWGLDSPIQQRGEMSTDEVYQKLKYFQNASD